VPTPLPWSAETPNLYQLLLPHRDGGNQVIESIPLKVGFRRSEIRGNQLFVNARPIRIKGVNRHEHDPDLGHYVTTESMEKTMSRIMMVKITERNEFAARAAGVSGSPSSFSWISRVLL